MTTFAYVLLVLLGAIVVVAIIWRVASRGRSVPRPAWLGWLVELDNPFTKTNRAAVIVERLDLQVGMAVLDVGCGPGRLTIPIARKVGPRGEVVAMDMQGPMLQRAQDKRRPQASPIFSFSGLAPARVNSAAIALTGRCS